MSAGEQIYLVMVIAAFGGFGLILGAVTWIERRWAHRNGR